MAKIKTIGEIGSNWNGDEKIGKKIIADTKNAGADYVKFQIWRANDLYKKSHPHWKQIKKAEFSFRTAKKFKDYADKIRIGCFWSVFYPEAVDELESLNVKLYKIASITSAFKHKHARETLEAVARTKKPVIISMGLGGDVSILKRIFRNNKKFFLYCISNYPTKINEINFNKIMKFDGFSDHTEGFLAPILFALKNKNSNSTKFLEKHISINESRGPDKPFSMNVNDFKNLILEINKVKQVKAK